MKEYFDFEDSSMTFSTEAAIGMPLVLKLSEKNTSVGW